VSTRVSPPDIRHRKNLGTIWQRAEVKKSSVFFDKRLLAHSANGVGAQDHCKLRHRRTVDLLTTSETESLLGAALAKTISLRSTDIHALRQDASSDAFASPPQSVVLPADFQDTRRQSDVSQDLQSGLV